MSRSQSALHQAKSSTSFECCTSLFILLWRSMTILVKSITVESSSFLNGIIYSLPTVFLVTMSQSWSIGETLSLSCTFGADESIPLIKGEDQTSSWITCGLYAMVVMTSTCYWYWFCICLSKKNIFLYSGNITLLGLEGTRIKTS